MPPQYLGSEATLCTAMSFPCMGPTYFIGIDGFGLVTTITDIPVQYTTMTLTCKVSTTPCSKYIIAEHLIHILLYITILKANVFLSWLAEHLNNTITVKIPMEYCAHTTRILLSNKIRLTLLSLCLSKPQWCTMVKAVVSFYLAASSSFEESSAYKAHHQTCDSKCLQVIWNLCLFKNNLTIVSMPWHARMFMGISQDSTVAHTLNMNMVSGAYLYSTDSGQHQAVGYKVHEYLCGAQFTHHLKTCKRNINIKNASSMEQKGVKLSLRVEKLVTDSSLEHIGSSISRFARPIEGSNPSTPPPNDALLPPRLPP
ncbi:hypothetical protein ARMGADRAFT_1033059 [Armillaria gallica]|uniref:Uncharacterized protein n=1 Tax=Armillaria gallica TaxID=47427 RepID=A0A2H3DPV4_ARMGA|nr:hypothetical protein ARMGADRAFT_1033059 [Armillaria gallica]